MAKTAKNDSVVNYISRTATKEEMIEFLITDDRQAFASLKLLGKDFLDGQTDEMILQFVDSANAWQPEFFDSAKSIIKSFIIEEPQERKSLGNAELAELESNCSVIKENTKFSYHKASFSFYCPKDGENISGLAEHILNCMMQEFVNLTTYCPSTPYKVDDKNGGRKRVKPETASLPEKNILPEEYLTRLEEFEKELWKELKNSETAETAGTTETN